MPNQYLRLVYIGEFMLAVIAILSLWSQVGGQEHLDLMPWYLKFILTSALALITVFGTVAAVSHPDAWNAKTIAFLILGLLVACAMGFVTYYYHLHENDEDQDDDTKPGVARLASPQRAGRSPQRVGAHSGFQRSAQSRRRSLAATQAEFTRHGFCGRFLSRPGSFNLGGLRP